MFSRINWYHEGELISGNGKQNSYIYEQPTLKFGTRYWAELTRTDDGKAIRTCDCVPVRKDVRVADRITLIPLGRNYPRTWAIDTELNGVYAIYDVAGKYLGSGNFGEEYGSPNLVISYAYTSGTYIIYFEATDGTKDVKKLFVE